MKKIIVLSLCLLVVFSLVGCSEKSLAGQAIGQGYGDMPKEVCKEEQEALKDCIESKSEEVVEEYDDWQGKNAAGKEENWEEADDVLGPCGIKDVVHSEIYTLYLEENPMGSNVDVYDFLGQNIKVKLDDIGMEFDIPVAYFTINGDQQPPGLPAGGEDGVFQDGMVQDLKLRVVKVINDPQNQFDGEKVNFCFYLN